MVCIGEGEEAALRRLGTVEAGTGVILPRSDREKAHPRP